MYTLVRASFVRKTYAEALAQRNVAVVEAQGNGTRASATNSRGSSHRQMGRHASPKGMAGAASAMAEAYLDAGVDHGREIP